MAKSISICLGLTISLILVQLSNSFIYVNYRCNRSDDFHVRYIVPDNLQLYFYVKDRVIRMSWIDFYINDHPGEEVKEDGKSYYLAYRQPETAGYNLMEKVPHFSQNGSTRVICHVSEMPSGNTKIYALERGASQAYEVIFNDKIAG